MWLHNVFLAKVKTLKKPRLERGGSSQLPAERGSLGKAAGVSQAWKLNALMMALSPQSKNLLKIQTFKMATD